MGFYVELSVSESVSLSLRDMVLLSLSFRPMPRHRLWKHDEQGVR
jgi:hypothetical protein